MNKHISSRIVSYSPTLSLVLYPLYLLFRTIFHGLRNLFWYLNGTSSALEHSKHDYGTSAHTLKIVTRWMFDPVDQRNSLRDFVLIHESFVHPRVVLAEEVTLYHLNSEQVVFVECAKGETPWNMNHFSFAREAQFTKAWRAIVMPLSSAHRIADEIGQVKGQIISLGSVSRSGSTVLAKAFQETGHFVSYCEPGVLQDVGEYVDKFEQHLKSQFLTTTVSLLCKTTNLDLDGHCIKPRPKLYTLLSSVLELYPDASCLFLYRNLRHLAPSRFRMHTLTPTGNLFLYGSTLFKLLHHLIPTFLWFGNDISASYQPKTLYGTVLKSPLERFQMYYKWTSDNKKVAAVKYDHLLTDLEGWLSAIFRHCGVSPDYLPLALKAFDRDSQEGSIMSRRQMAKSKAPSAMTTADEEDIRRMCASLGLPDILNIDTLPRTITRG